MTDLSISRKRNGSPTMPASPSVPLAALTPRPRTRSFIVGWTGSGKSTLAGALLEEYHRLHPRHVIYVIDPKRRFVPVDSDPADTALFPDGARERNFGRRDGVPVNGDFLSKPKTPAENACCFVVQDQGTVRDLCEWLYTHATVRRPSLLFADESFDLVSRSFGDPFRRLIQQGREIGVGSLVINQRPANIDATWITESQQLYIGRLIRPEDRERIQKSSSVMDAWPVLSRPIAKHEWLYLDQENERMQRFRLKF